MIHLVSDRTVNHDVIQFPIERWPWSTMSEAAAVKHLNQAIAAIEGDRPQEIVRAREVLYWLAAECPHAMVKHQAAAALGIGGGTEPPSAA